MQALYSKSVAEHTSAHEGTLTHTQGKYSNLEHRGCGGGFMVSLFFYVSKQTL